MWSGRLIKAVFGAETDAFATTVPAHPALDPTEVTAA